MASVESISSLIQQVVKAGKDRVPIIVEKAKQLMDLTLKLIEADRLAREMNRKRLERAAPLTTPSQRATTRLKAVVAHMRSVDPDEFVKKLIDQYDTLKQYFGSDQFSSDAKQALDDAAVKAIEL